MKGLGATWIDAGLGEELDAGEGPPSAPARGAQGAKGTQGATGAGRQGTLGDWAGTGDAARVDQRQADIYSLEQVIRDDELKSNEADAFYDMLDRLKRGRYPLSEKQRAWVHRRAAELGVDVDPRSHQERNANVPRGREVETPAPLKNLPKTPPGRGTAY